MDGSAPITAADDIPRLPTAPEWLQRHHRKVTLECRSAVAAIAERDGITIEQAKAQFWGMGAGHKQPVPRVGSYEHGTGYWMED